MANEQTVQVTAADAEAVAHKLEDLGCSLSPAQQEALSRLVLRAVEGAREESDVQGYFTLVENPGAAAGINWGDHSFTGGVFPAGQGTTKVLIGLLLPAVQTPGNRRGNGRWLRAGPLNRTTPTSTRLAQEAGSSMPRLLSSCHPPSLMPPLLQPARG